MCRPVERCGCPQGSGWSALLLVCTTVMAICAAVSAVVLSLRPILAVRPLAPLAPAAALSPETGYAAVLARFTRTTVVKFN